MAYQVDPFRVAKIQVKGATHDLEVFRQYSLTPMIVSCVLDPLGAADVALLTGEQAWNLPVDYVARGGAASGHHPDNDHYHWKKHPTLLSLMLREHLATPSTGLSCSTGPLPLLRPAIWGPMKSSHQLLATIGGIPMWSQLGDSLRRSLARTS